MKPINLFKPEKNDFKQMLSIGGKQVSLNSQKILALVTNEDTHQFDDKRLSTDRMFSRGDIVHYDDDYYMVVTQVAHRYESFNGQMRRLENHIYLNMSFLSDAPNKYIMKIPVIPQKTGEFNLKTNNTWGIIDVVQRISLFVPQNEYTSRIIELENKPKGIIIFGRRPYNIIGVTNNDKGMYAINLELTTLEEKEYDKENGIYMPPLNWKNYENLSIYELPEDKVEPIPQVQTNVGTIKTTVDDSTWSTELKVTWNKDKSSPLYSEYLTGYKVGLYYGSVLGLEKTVSSPDTTEVTFDPFKDYEDSYTIKVQAIYSKEGTITYMLPQVETFKTNAEPVVKEQGTVTINYVDDKGVSIKPIIKLTGDVGSQYKTEQSVIPDYNFLTVEGATSGVFTKEPITVTYKYKKVEALGTVTVSYTTPDGIKLKDDVIIQQVVGTSYNTIKESFEGYTFNEVVGNVTGLIKSEPQTVKYIYKKVPVPVDDNQITHKAWSWSADGKDRFTTVYPNLNLLDGTSSTPRTKKGAGWNINIVTALTDLSVLKRGQKYTYSVWIENCDVDTQSACWIAPKNEVFREELGNVIPAGTSGLSTVTFTIPNDDILRCQASIDFISNQPNYHDVTYSKMKLEQGSVATPYMPSKGEIKPEDYPKYIGIYKDEKTTASTKPEDYTWTLIKDVGSSPEQVPVVPVVQTEPSTVVQVPVQAPVPPVPTQGKVTVYYKDDKNKDISDPVIMTGNVGDKYTAPYHRISDYNFTGDSGNTKGVYTVEPIEVTYKFEKEDDGGW